MQRTGFMRIFATIAIVVFSSMYLSSEKAASQEVEPLKYRKSQSELTPKQLEEASRYATPEMFQDTAGILWARGAARTATQQPGAVRDTLPRIPGQMGPGWIPDDAEQKIPRPDGDTPRQFGYDLFAAQTGDPTDPYASVVPEEYRLGTGDNLLINSWGRVDLELRLTIDRSGQVFIPKAGKLMLAGMTVAEAEKAIRRKLESVYSNFELSVTMGQLRTFRVFVLGEVNRPGAYTVTAAATLLDALYLAGGPNERGTMRRIRISRGSETTVCDLYDFLLTGQRKTDPRLEAGDAIFVDVAGVRAVMRGRVKRPAIYELRNSTTLREFIDLAGGFDADAYRDRVMIDRLRSDDGRELLDVDLTEQMDTYGWEMPVQDGDDISVFSMNEMRTNVVWLGGWVKHPGAFERTDSMTVGDLIDMGAQLKADAYTARADLVRRTPTGGWQLIAVDLQAILDGDASADMILEDRDRLAVYQVWEVERPKHVWIDGEIRRPGEFELFEAMRLSDLVFRAGNPTREALLTNVAVTRRNPDGQTELITKDLNAVLNHGDLTQDILLRDGDHVFVRANPDSRAQDLITLIGEVRFPGRYTLLGANESFYELIQRAGGLTELAFPAGTIFIRQDISQEARERNLGDILTNSQPFLEDSLGRVYREQLLDFNPDQMTRIVLDVPRILKDRGGVSDVILRDGDYVVIPRTPSGIQVLGAVASPGTIQYIQKWRVRDYVNQAGGTIRSSDGEETRIIKANGRVVACENKNLPIELGDAVFVPPKIERQKDWVKAVTGVSHGVQIVGGVAMSILIVNNLIK